MVNNGGKITEKQQTHRDSNDTAFELCHFRIGVFLSLSLSLFLLIDKITFETWIRLYDEYLDRIRCAAFVRLVSRRKLHFSASEFVFELVFLLAHTQHRFHSCNRYCFCCDLLSLVYFNCNCISHRVHIGAFSIVYTCIRIQIHIRKHNIVYLLRISCVFNCFHTNVTVFIIAHIRRWQRFPTTEVE